MKLSKKSEYGLRAMLDLAAHADEGAVRLKDLADRNNIPLKFLEQIFLTLRNAGVIRSQVGARGGYRLSRPAERSRWAKSSARWMAPSRRWDASARSLTSHAPARTSARVRYGRR
jgi:predicted transcriptional regulator